MAAMVDAPLIRQCLHVRPAPLVSSEDENLLPLENNSSSPMHDMYDTAALFCRHRKRHAWDMIQNIAHEPPHQTQLSGVQYARCSERGALPSVSSTSSTSRVCMPVSFSSSHCPSTFKGVAAGRFVAGVPAAEGPAGVVDLTGVDAALPPPAAPPASQEYFFLLPPSPNLPPSMPAVAILAVSFADLCCWASLNLDSCILRSFFVTFFSESNSIAFGVSGPPGVIIPGVLAPPGAADVLRLARLASRASSALRS